MILAKQSHSVMEVQKYHKAMTNEPAVSVCCTVNALIPCRTFRKLTAFILLPSCQNSVDVFIGYFDIFTFVLFWFVYLPYNMPTVKRSANSSLSREGKITEINT